jgi:hypothetical protein
MSTIKEPDVDLSHRASPPENHTLQYNQDIADELPIHPPGYNVHSMPAPKPALDPLADDAAHKESVEDQSNSMNTIAIEVPPSYIENSEVDLVARALSVLGSPKQLGTWMKTALPSLRGQTPYSLMNSEEGRKQVEVVLGRIEHGIY